MNIPAKIKNRFPTDFSLILATAVVLFLISAICIYGMFFFKIAQLQEMAPAVKMAHMARMNRIVSPFLIALLLLLGICVPRRLLPASWVNRLVLFLALLALAVSWYAGVGAGLLMIVGASLLLQLVVLALALAGSDQLHFEKKGYWLRVGSSLIHLGLILFVLDLFFHHLPGLHLVLFWVTTVSVVAGLLASFYAESVAVLFTRRGRGEVPPAPERNSALSGQGDRAGQHGSGS